MTLTKTITFFLFLLSGFLSKAQNKERYNSFSYNVNEGLLQTTINDVSFDKNNFFWIGYPNGIQKFDGKNFISIPIQPGLPDDKWVNFFRSQNGTLLVSHSKGISRYDVNNNRFKQIYNTYSSQRTTFSFIGEYANIIYIYTSSGNIIELNSFTLKMIAVNGSGFQEYSLITEEIPKFSDNIINDKVAFILNYQLYLWDLKKRKIIYRSAFMPDMFNSFLKMENENEVLFFGKSNPDLKYYNFRNREIKNISVNKKNIVQTFRSIFYTWQNKKLLTLNNHLYETDSSFNIKKELVNFQNQPLAGNSSVSRIKEDNFGNLYLVTIYDGIKKIIRNNYPIKYYGTEKKEGNYIISIHPDKKRNRILAGTTQNGLLIFDTLQTLIKHFKTSPLPNKPFGISVITKANNGDYMLFAGEQTVWRLASDLTTITPVKFSSTKRINEGGIGYFSNFLFENNQESVVQSQGLVYRTNLVANTVTEYNGASRTVMSGLFYKNNILMHANDELIYLDAVTFKEIKRIPFKNTGGVRCFAKPLRPPGKDAGYIYAGSNKGVFKIDSTGKILQHLTKENGLPDECIYAMAIDGEGLLWCSSNKGIFRIDKNNEILQLKKEDGLQENEFNTNVVSRAEDGEIYFGGINGISSFYPSGISSFEEKINLLITGIKINNKEKFIDTAVWNIDKITLSHDQNSISFDFIAMANKNPGQYIYQYRMKGLENQWIQNNELQTIRYYLPPGKYFFQLYASRFFDKDAKPMKEISITILQPYWKTWWFFSGLAVLMIAILIYSVNRYNRSKYRKKLLDLEKEYMIQLERERISRDLHDNIGAYANAVLYSTELLEKEKESEKKSELMKDLKFASKDIITSLRATIWALKKDNYSAEDCLLRIRDFVQPFNRYYPHIHFKIEGEASSQKKLHYSKALDVVRIVQEAITNAIKHSAAENIEIKSIDKDGKWCLTVTDDGKGFNKQIIKTTDQGNGLNNMKKRAADSKIELGIQTHLNSGTSISILV
ncbi:MAG: ATP-binding protein [Ferruginibacter sp.]